VNCKVGRVPKEEIGLEGREKIMGPDLMEPMCNPVAQAEILNAEKGGCQIFSVNGNHQLAVTLSPNRIRN